MTRVVFDPANRTESQKELFEDPLQLDVLGRRPFVTHWATNPSDWGSPPINMLLI